MINYDYLSHAQVGQQFQNQADDYAEARRPYSDILLDFIVQTVFKKSQNAPSIELQNLSVLDLGCGTGISTRALSQKGFTKVNGLDISEGMLLKAKEGDTVSKDSYFTGDVTDIGRVFGEKKFDLITAFSAFHWFCTPEAIESIKTALKADGLFIIAGSLKNQERDQNKKELWSLIESLQGKPVHDPKENFNPIKMLEDSGFIVEEHSFETDQAYDLEQATKRRASFSGWCNMPEHLRNEGRPLLRDLLQKQIERQNHEDGKLHDQKVETCLVAYKL